MNLGGPELIVVLVGVALLFGSSQLPRARSIGEAQYEFKRGSGRSESADNRGELINQR